MTRLFLLLFVCSFFDKICGSGVATAAVEIVDLKQIEPDLIVDMIYFSDDNFLGRRVAGYQENVCLLTRQAAQALRAASKRLQAEGKKAKRDFRFLIRDCYRPIKAVNDFMRWVKTPVKEGSQKKYFPELGKKDLVPKGYIAPVSGHSRGSSIDLTIVEIDEKKIPHELDMGTRLDFFSELSHTANKHISILAQGNRSLLLRVMQPEFVNYKKEWWHFVLREEPSKKEGFDFDVLSSSVTAAVVKKADYSSRSLSDSDLVIDEASLLTLLDGETAAPLSLGATLDHIQQQGAGTVEVDGSGRKSAHDLMSYKNTYAKIFATLDRDIKSIVKDMAIDWEHDITKTYQPNSAKTEDGRKFRLNGNVMRVFDQNWLKSKSARFQLIGIVNRIDRRDFFAEDNDCGETRLLYRLAYVVRKNGKMSSSRLPFTFNLVFTNKNDGSGCQATAKLWQGWYKKTLSDGENIKQLLSGPLDWTKLQFKQFEVNAQIARFPSDLERQEKRYFAGQALYWMRIFAMRSGGFASIKLENTPDVVALRKDEKKRQALAILIARQVPSIDQGAFQLPEEYLSDLALSWSTQGSSRMGNRPWDLIYTKKEADDILKKAGKKHEGGFVVDAASLLERLNTSTCMGCHQSASTAGFHFLGQDRFDWDNDTSGIRSATDGNRLALAYSPHVSMEFTRRRTYLNALAIGNRPDSFREHPSRPEMSMAKKGVLADMPCPLDAGTRNSRMGAKAVWSCSENHDLKCVDVVKNTKASFGLGICRTSLKKLTAGKACRQYEISDQTSQQLSQREKVNSNLTSWNVHAFRDRVVSDKQLYPISEGVLDTVSLNCRPTRIGVPLGRVTRNCKSNEKSLTGFRKSADGEVPDDFCAVVGGKGFEEMAKGFFDSQVFAKGVSRGMLNTCNRELPCREDYICQELPDFLSSVRFGVNPALVGQLQQEGVGFCTPTYFVYQLRLDGHPVP